MKRKLEAVLMIIIGLGILWYLWIVGGNRGLVAAATHTAGYTLPYEVLLGLVGLALVLAGLVLMLGKARE